ISNGGKIVVFDVRPGTPAAEAGIEKGDVIVGFDGKAPTLSQVRKAIDGPVGTVLRLQVASKDGTTRTVAVTLRDWV
ncbi:MAG TPA: PDZ domain-containing protein, partial [Candidatus Baltobacteraceae bacterium]|nr:PDZ domain-containing protein [Candidatus Baltobacteraceae bacterium]